MFKVQHPKSKVTIGTFVLFLTTVLCSCGGGTAVKPSATGSIYEILVVSPKAPYADAIRDSLAADMPCLPQMEPYFNVTEVTPALFDNILKPTRNILFVDVNPERYTTNKIVYTTDLYSHPQAVCRMQIVSEDEVAAFWAENAARVRQWFVRQEIERQSKFYRGFVNVSGRELMQKQLGVDMLIPNDYQLIMDTLSGDLRFLWFCNNKGSMRRDLVVYSYPYRDAETFTLPYLMQKRDAVMGEYVTGTIDGSSVGTEYKHFPPQFADLSVQTSGYAAEVRGLWKMYGGASMGGPFVSHTRVDEISQRVITAEVFVFAPGQKKRNALRQAEAILYTLILPQEVNQLKEVSVSAQEAE